MSKKNQKLINPDIFRQAIIGSFTKLNPVYMMKNPVMFVVEIGFLVTLVLSIFPSVFGDVNNTHLRVRGAAGDGAVRELCGVSSGGAREGAGR